MWVLSWKRYKLSKLATVVSIIGAFTRYGGGMALFSGLIPGALICLAIGVGLHFGAEQINFSAWKKLVRSKGIEEEIRKGNIEVAKRLLNGTTDEKVRKYVASLNPNMRI